MDLPDNNLCIGIVTEDNSDILRYIQPLNIATQHVNVSHHELMFSKRIDAPFEEYPWEENMMEIVNAPCMAIVVQTSEIRWMAKSFGRMFHSEKGIQRYNRTFLYLPVVTRLMSNQEFEDHISEVFRMKEMDFMPDLDIVKVVKEMYVESQHVNSLKGDNSSTKLEDMNIEIITHTFVGVTPYDPIILDVWNARTGFLYQANLYPYKLDNLMGKNITLVTINYPPLTVIDWDKDPRTYDGLEPQFIFEWSRKLNFTYGWAHDDDYWGWIYKNGTGVGIFGILSMDKADVAFNAFYLWEPEHHFLDYSTVHFKTSIILICPKPKLVPGWMVPILPFNYNMWMAVLISVLGCTTALYIFSVSSVKFLARDTGAKMVNMYSSWIECAFRTSGLLVLQVPPDERDWSTPRYVPMRHLVTWLILFYFVVTTAYCGGLAMVLTVPRYQKPIETTRDMADSNMKWTGLYEAYLIGVKDSTDPVMARVVKNFHLDASREELIPWLSKKVATKKYCLVLEKMLGGAFFMPTFVNEDTMNYMRIMKEDLFFSLAVFATRKGSPLMHHVNVMLGKARDAGLFFYWEALTVRNYLSTRKQLAVTQSRIQFDDGPIKLQVHHIQGSFYLLAFGLSLGTVVFVFELLIYRLNEIKEEMMNKKLLKGKISVMSYPPLKQDIRLTR
ncbi:hypothetical protein L9F63_010321 [Diploptera punctata]|uniref:Ionotropic glutamate receptor C-terminal domain-containing protein n=1 Tax=Diploptera punctata TaxID=6984 RepID=A0AAD8AI65_DIPPU|nr:hypothetical protein L9F63_010321 [Diploptera punctata]